MFDNLRRQQLNLTLVSIPLEYSVEFKAKLQAESVKFLLAPNEQIEISIKDLPKVDNILKEVVLPALLPTQFYWLLAKAGLENPVNVFLDGLKETDIEQYALYRGFLRGARFYEFKKSHEMFTTVKPYLLQIDPTLQLELEDVKALWKLAAKI